MRQYSKNLFNYILILMSVITCILLLNSEINKLHVHASEYIEHTHIYTTTYDSTNHWSYCTVCGEVKDKLEHVYTDDWYLGYESCNHTNYSIRTCKCGYSYTYRKPHAESTTWANTGARGVHFKRCSVCST